jgi:hypothetical protein
MEQWRSNLRGWNLLGYQADEVVGKATAAIFHVVNEVVKRSQGRNSVNLLNQDLMCTFLLKLENLELQIHTNGLI